ncbi:hypothetical protein Tco_1242203 [Tanacetum coccineum]
MHSFRRPPRGGAEQVQMEELETLMQSVILTPISDRMTWTLDSSGEFSVASVRKLIDNKMIPEGDHETRGVETSRHLFFEYCMAKQVTQLINRWWDVSDMEIDSYEWWKTWSVNIRMPSRNKKMLEGVYYVMWWLIWSFRNKKIFEDKRRRWLLSLRLLVAPGISHFLFEDDFESDFEFEPLEDPSEEDAPDPYEATIARWRADVLSRSSSSSSSSSSSASVPPVSLLIVPALPGLPRRHAILVLPGQEIPFGRPYRTHPNGVRRMLTARKRVHPFRACIPANCRRSRYVSSSPSSRKRRRVSPYSSPSASLSSSASDGSSRKRADFLPPRKRLRGSSSAFHQEVSIEAGTEVSIKATIEVTAEVAAKPVLPEQTVAERLEEHEVVIQEMIERQLGFVTEELRQSRMAHFTDMESLRRMETFLKNMSIGARYAGFGRGIQANEDAQGQLRRPL